MSSTKIEFAVQMTCESCERAVRQSLDAVEGVRGVEINRSTGSVIVDTTLSTDDVRARIASTGRKVVIKGLGRIAGVSILDTGHENVQGVVRFVQVQPDLCVIDGTVDGLKPGVQHLLSIHECGDMSNGCESVGDYYDPRGNLTGSNLNESNINGSGSLLGSPGRRVYGKLGLVEVNNEGRALFRMEDEVMSLPEVIGRALVISEIANNIPKRLSCGIIARSAGLFQNPKTICACDGLSLWDEQNTPKKSSKSTL